MIKKIDLISLNYIECYGENYKRTDNEVFYCNITIRYLTLIQKTLSFPFVIHMCFNSE